MSVWKRSTWVIGLLALLGLLSACGSMLDSLGSCEQFLKDFQSAENCLVIAYREYDGEPDQGSASNRYWQCGEDWMQIKATGTSVFAYLYQDGIYYDNVGTAGVENGHILWNVGADRGNEKPWLLEFHWDPEKVKLLERTRDEDGIHILLNVSEPLSSGDASAESYTAEFTFHKDGTFSNVHLKAALKEPNGGIRMMEEVQFGAVNREEQVAREMEVAFRSRVTPLRSSITGSQVTYGGLSITLPQGYTCREGSAGLLLLKDGTEVGGITHWNAPEEESDWIHSLGLWDALSNASYFLMNGENTVYVSFVNEFDPDSLNHGRSFYPRGDIVYDVWVDRNRISQEEAGILTESLVITQWQPEPEEEVPLIDLTQLPRGFGCEAQENGSIRITQGGAAVGAVDVYAIPGGGLTTWDPYFRWLGSLGIPDYGDDTLCYMGGSSLYGNWEMHFESDLPPGQTGNVSRYHTFYVGKTKVWDVWFDLTVIDRSTMDLLLEAVTVQ